MDVRDVDPNLLKLFQFQVFSKLEGAVTSGMILLVDRRGLYRELAAAHEPITVDVLAERSRLHRRWVEEWVHNQAAARLVDVEYRDDGSEVYSLSPEAILVLADENNPAFGMGMFHRLPQTMDSLSVLPESFRTGIGHDYDSHGPDGAVGIERSFEPWSRSYLVPIVMPALDGMVDRLEAGASVADVGCGAGGAAIRLARAFPKSRVTGYDISRHALASHAGDPSILETRRGVVAGGHQGSRHFRRERGEESDGVVDVRHQRHELHVLGDVGRRWRRSGNSGSPRIEGTLVGRRCRLHAL